MSQFDKAFELTLGHEGGYVNNPRDPGGETKFGISKRSYPNVDIKALTVEAAKAIYRRDYWDKCKCDTLEPDVAYVMFDTAINSGVDRAIRILQRACAVKEDGVLGPITISTARSFGEKRMAARYIGQRLDFMNDLKTWETFGRGWSQRCAEILKGL